MHCRFGSFKNRGKRHIGFRSIHLFREYSAVGDIPMLALFTELLSSPKISGPRLELYVSRPPRIVTEGS